MIQRPLHLIIQAGAKPRTGYFSGWFALFSALTAVPLVVIIWEVVRKGYKQINLNFFTETAPSTLDAMLAKINGEIHSRRNRQWNHRHITYGGTGLRYRYPDRYYGWNLLIGKPKTLFSHVDPFF